MSQVGDSRFAADRRSSLGLELNRIVLLEVVTAALLVTIAWNFWQVRYSFTLWDEGFFWYGVQQVMRGGVPIRDFMAYDPGRYYTMAAVMSLWGDSGLLALRWAAVFFEAAVVSGMLVLLGGAIGRRALSFYVLAALAVLAWLQPYFKVHDFLACLLLLAGLAQLARRGDMASHVLAGLSVGLAAVFGRNHGVYGVFGSMVVIAWLQVGRWNWRALAAGLTGWSLGVVVGFSPIILMFAIVPGFAGAFWDSVRAIFEYGSTNIGLPVPWPWLANGSSWPVLARHVLIGFGFIALLVFAVGSLGYVFVQRFRARPVSPLFLAAAALAFPYAQYAFSRADIVHLSLGSYPFALGCLLLIGGQPPIRRTALALAFSVGSVGLLLPEHLGFRCEWNPTCQPVEISGSNFIVDPSTQWEVKFLRDAAARYAPGDAPMMVTPFWPGAYALLDKRSPVWDIYALIPRPEHFQQREIGRLKATPPGVIIINDIRMDNRDDFFFRTTHPIEYAYIEANFDRVTGLADPSLEMFTRRESKRRAP